MGKKQMFKWTKMGKKIFQINPLNNGTKWLETKIKPKEQTAGVKL